VGPYVTEAIELEVLPAGTVPAGTDDPVFLEVEVEPKNPYVQQQVRVTVRLLHAVNLLDGSLDEPEGDAWMLKRLEQQDIRYETRRNGRRYGVVERNYALFPQKSGKLVLPALHFRGRIAQANRINRFFDQGQAVRRQSQPVEIDVRPRPASFPPDQPWLPATRLELWEQFEPNGTLKQGEPATRTLEIKAQGLLAAQLPDLPLPDVPGLSAYADQPVLQEETGPRGLHSSRRQKLALVPTRSGTLTLPEVTIPWWNVNTDRLEYARLPARTLQVVATPARQNMARHSVDGALNQGDHSQTSGPSAAAVPAQPANLPVAGLPAWTWPWIALALLLGWLVHAWFCLRRRAHRQQPLPVGQEAEPADTRAARKAWQQAAEGGDLGAMQRALLAWARAEGYEVTHLEQLADRLQDQALAEEIRSLAQARFRPQGQWQADRLKQLLRKGLPAVKRASSSSVEGGLPGLYE